MNPRTIVVILLCVVCGLSAAIGVTKLRGGPAREVKTVPVVVAAADIPRGVMATSSLLTVRDWPESLVPPGALSKIEDAADRAVLAPIVKDEPVLEGKVASRDAGRGLAPLIPSGMRAYTVLTKTIASGVAGFILPGNKVDVLLTVAKTDRDDDSGGGSTTTLLQHVEILAVDQKLDAPSQNKVDLKDMRSVTLLVTPEQAAMLSLAQDKGTLYLSLRNDSDDQPADTRLVTLKQLRVTQDTQTAPPAVASTEKDKKGFGSMLLEALRAAGAAGTHVAAQQPAPDPVHIRTLRGRSAGDVMVYLDRNDRPRR